MSPQGEDLQDRSVPELMRELAQETGTLVRQELQLARAEIAASAKRTGIGIGELGGAALLGLFALGALTTAAIAALALALPVWAAALIVAGVEGSGAAVLGLRGRTHVAAGMPPKPEQTIETVKEDVEWAKTRISSGRP
jgi:Putative Actinobacterial Holin-X, holin superfamily III